MRDIVSDDLDCQVVRLLIKTISCIPKFYFAGSGENGKTNGCASCEHRSSDAAEGCRVLWPESHARPVAGCFSL